MGWVVVFKERVVEMDDLKVIYLGLKSLRAMIAIKIIQDKEEEELLLLLGTRTKVWLRSREVECEDKDVNLE